MMDEASIEIVDARNQKQIDKGNSPFILGLAQQAMRGMLPTPNASDWNTGTKPETYEARKQRHAAKGVNLQMSLRQMAMGMLPTPMASDCGEKVTGLENQQSMVKIVRQITGQTSQLNPQFVAEMMGFPSNWTELPFQSGEQKVSKDMETQ
jgi:hypothetical protein